MHKYKLVFSAAAQKDIKNLDTVTRKRIGQKILFFMDQPDPLVYARRLVHSTIGEYRFRVGHYRVVFDIIGDELHVVNIKHRKDVYR